jgi:hypothetical protein
MAALEDEGPGDIVKEFASRAMRGWASKKRGASLEARRETDKPVPDKEDGRRRRATGRDLQFNIKVKPEWREEVRRLSEERDIGMAELLENILAEWKALKSKGAKP